MSHVRFRLVFGIQFDAVDLLWYPAGIVPLVALHVLLRRAPSTRFEILDD